MKISLTIISIVLMSFTTNNRFIDMQKYNDYTEFNFENLVYWMKHYNIKNIDIVIAQSIHETGHFSSRIFSENNNLFGMHHPRVRKTTSLGERYNSAYYKNWIHSVKDYALFQQYYENRINNCKDYYEFLNDIYAEDSLYVEKLKKINVPLD